MRIIARYLPRKCRRVITVCVVVSLAAFILSLHTGIQEIQLNTRQFLIKVNDPFGSRHKRTCTLQQYLKHEATSNNKATQVSRTDYEGNSQCFIGGNNHADIQMEDIWDRINLGYPDFVVTVTGWLDTIQVKSWTAKPLHVIVMPHSHQDPGWLETLDSYFSMSTQPTLDLMIEKLTANPTWSFIWTEVGLLQMWWTKATNKQKLLFKSLVQRGQLELVYGSWIMTDESVAHYGAMLDQLMEGHLWLKHNLNVTVENSWAIDPFGHSSTMPYLLGQSGIQNMVIQRVHYAVKRHFAQQKDFEFIWRQNWDDTGTTDIFCHMMPFMLYGIPYSCGPNRHVCCKFDFHQKQCFHGKKHTDVLHVTNDNVAELANELWEQLQMKSELFRSNVLLLPHGDDFRYKTTEEWDEQFENLQTIFKYINAKPEMQMKIEFGTLKDYFKHLHKGSGRHKADNDYPVLSGDFFPYTDRSDQYWSGFYSTRPHFKFLVRQLQQFLRSAEILFTFCMSYLNVNTNMWDLYSKLEKARRTLALSQHHDAITGTSKRHVMNDYSDRVRSALRDIFEVNKQSITNILGDKSQNNILVQLTEDYPKDGYFPSKLLCSLNTSINLVVWNDVGQPRHDLIHIVVDKPYVKVTNKLKQPIKYQISPVWDTSQRSVETKNYLLSIEVDVGAFSLSTFTVCADTSVDTSGSNVKFAALFNVTNSKDKSLPLDIGHFRMNQFPSSSITVSNSYLTALFKTCDGMLYSVTYKDHGETYKADTHFVTYTTGRHMQPFRDKSGAYTFIPDGVAKDFSEKPDVIITKGELFTEIRAIYKDIVHVSRIYNISGSLGHIIHVENFVNINNQRWNNTELAMRVETSLNSNDYFYSDSNGFQLHRRKTRSRMSLQGNIYPMTSSAVLEDNMSRFTLLTSESHGVASLVTGWLEVILDRRLLQDDWRGLNQGVTDNKLTKSSFYLTFQKKINGYKEELSKNKYMRVDTFRTSHLADILNSPLKVYSTSVIDTIPDDRKNGQFLPTLPCGWHILNIRILPVHSKHKEALVTIHRRGLDCSFSDESMACSGKGSLGWSDFGLQLLTVSEMSLTGVSEISNHPISNIIDIKPMEIKTYKIAFR